VIYTAGVVRDALLEKLTDSHIDDVLAAKVDGLLNVDAAISEAGDASLIIFSSAAATFGSAGQANYAAAIAFVAAFAADRRGGGRDVRALAWGRWDGIGGLAGGLDERDRAASARVGILGLSVEDALHAFDAALRHDDAVLVPIRLDRAALRRLAADDSLPLLLTGLAGRRAGAGGPAGAPTPAALRRLSGADRRAAVRLLVRTQIATVLGHTGVDAIGLTSMLVDCGFDSLMAVELRNRLSGPTGLTLPSTLVFDHPTAGDLADWLDARLAESPAPADGPAPGAATAAAGAGPGAGAGSATVASLYTMAFQSGRWGEAFALLRAVAALRTRFTAGEDVVGTPATLARGAVGCRCTASRRASPSEGSTTTRGSARPSPGCGTSTPWRSPDSPRANRCRAASRPSWAPRPERLPRTRRGGRRSCWVRRRVAGSHTVSPSTWSGRGIPWPGSSSSTRTPRRAISSASSAWPSWTG
jgi:hypothetical protein